MSFRNFCFLQTEWWRSATRRNVNLRFVRRFETYVGREYRY